MRSDRPKAPAVPRVADDTRERIVAGAARAFGKLGYAETRVEDILHAADVSRPTFYKAFDGKDDVFRLLSKRHHQEIKERLVRSLEGAGGPLAQVESIIRAFMQWRAELGPLGRVLDQEARAPGSRIQRHREELIDALTELSGGLLAAAGRGHVDPVLFRGLVGALETIADQLLLHRPVREDAIARATGIGLLIVAGALGQSEGVLPTIPQPTEKR